MTHKDKCVTDMMASFDGKIMLVPEERGVIFSALQDMYDRGYYQRDKEVFLSKQKDIALKHLNIIRKMKKKELVQSLINTGSISLNPFQIELNRPRYTIGIGTVLEDPIDQQTPEAYIDSLIEKAEDYYQEYAYDLNRENFFFDIGVTDSLYLTTSDWASDDLDTAIQMALELDVTEIWDSQFEDYIFIDDQGNIVELEDEE